MSIRDLIDDAVVCLTCGEKGLRNCKCPPRRTTKLVCTVCHAETLVDWQEGDPDGEPIETWCPDCKPRRGKKR